MQVRIGLPVEHNVYSGNEIMWRYCNLRVQDKKWTRVAASLDDFAARSDALREQCRASGSRRSFRPSRKARCHRYVAAISQLLKAVSYPWMGVCRMKAS